MCPLWTLSVRAYCLTIPDVADKLNHYLELDEKICELGSQGRTEQTIRAGGSLIKSCDELKASDMQYSRVYCDLSIPEGITRKKTGS
jgi:hypothetical protein